MRNGGCAVCSAVNRLKINRGFPNKPNHLSGFFGDLAYGGFTWMTSNKVHNGFSFFCPCLYLATFGNAHL